MVIETTSAKETFEAGYRLAQSVHPGQIYCLNGDLAPRSPSCRCTRRDGCRCTILMYTALPMSVKWMKSVMKNTFFQMVYA